MKRIRLETATITQLVEHYAELGVSQDQALLREDTQTFNRLFDRICDIERALKLRQGDQRRALIPLYRHPNIQVQLNAAKATLAISPASARKALEAIRISNWMPQSLDAGMCLRALDEGVFRPI